MPFRFSTLLAPPLMFLLLGLPAAQAQTNSRQTSAKLDLYVTRAEAAAFLLRHRDPPVPNIRNDGKYPDVLDNEWYTRFVMAAVDMGMWQPDPLTKRVRPHKIISRGEYLRMMTAAFNLRTNGPYAYTDIDATHPYEAEAGVAARYKLFFNPEDPLRLRADLPVTHAEASKAYYRLLGNKPDLPLQQRFAFQKQQARQPQSSAPKTDNVLRSYVTAVSRALVKNVLQKQQQKKPSVAERIQNEVIAATNAERLAAGLPPLTVNKKLQAAAAQHAKDMYERGYFSHFTPEGLNYVDRIKASGYTDVDPVACSCTQVFNLQEAKQEQRTIGPNYIEYQADICSCTPKIALGENLAKGQMTVEEVVQDWMDSPGHRRNILEPSFDEIGVGIFRNMWVQNFGKFEVH